MSHIPYKEYDVKCNGRVIAQASYPATEACSWWYTIKVWTPEGGFIKSAQHLTDDGRQFDLIEAK